MLMIILIMKINPVLRVKINIIGIILKTLIVHRRSSLIIILELHFRN
jgi:hypothetical protein